MSNRDDDKKKKNQGNPGSGRPGTKFMERPKQDDSKDSSSSDPWAGGEDGKDTDDVGVHPEIPAEGKQKPGKQQPKPGWEKEADEGNVAEEDDDKE